MARLKLLLIVGLLIIAALAAVGARLQWAASTPSRPKALPATAIWVPVPPEPLEFSPRGYWLACWLDPARKVNRCKLTDYKGNPDFEADFSPFTGSNPLPDDRLHLKPVTSTMELWTKIDKDVFLIVHLQDGTVLVPTRDLSQLQQHYVPD